jgi:hypothetical protein
MRGELVAVNLIFTSATWLADISSTTIDQKSQSAFFGSAADYQRRNPTVHDRPSFFSFDYASYLQISSPVFCYAARR